MSKVYADTVEQPDDLPSLTLGATGDSVTVGGTSINTEYCQRLRWKYFISIRWCWYAVECKYRFPK